MPEPKPHIPVKRKYLIERGTRGSDGRTFAPYYILGIASSVTASDALKQYAGDAKPGDILRASALGPWIAATVTYDDGQAQLQLYEEVEG